VIDVTISLLKSIAAHDDYTLEHSMNVAKYAYQIARKMALSEKICTQTFLGGLLHDIGKIGVSQTILNKREPLSNYEYAKIQLHPLIGYDILQIKILKDKEIDNIALYHHERIDGKGYPYGKRGEKIPLVAKIMSVADTYDAMTTKRPYRAAFPIEYAIQQLRNGIGTHYDGEIVNAFISDR
jgi:putative nucleotidyltransferase with HDIG domain